MNKNTAFQRPRLHYRICTTLLLASCSPAAPVTIHLAKLQIKIPIILSATNRHFWPHYQK